jgi:ABC-type glycerol-3-phosphate transport system substrate-binding protein
MSRPSPRTDRSDAARASVLPRTSRRRVLTGMGLGSLALAAGPMLTACGSGSEQKVSKATDAELPTFKALDNDAVKPDMPESEDGVPAAFFNYPEPFASVDEAPLDGDTFTALGFLYGAAPNPRGKNSAWQAVEEGLGGKIDITAVGDADYATKVNTTLSGSKLPDLMVNDGAAFPDVEPFLEESCVDLTEYLGGDKIADYPNLQAIPQIFWEDCVSNGKLYYLPIPRNITGGVGVVNTGLLKERVGVESTAEFRDIDDFEAAMKELTDKGSDRWALGSSKFGLSMFRGMFNVPNGWRLDGDTLTKDTETDEYVEMLKFVRKLVDAGYFIPGSDGWEKSQMQDAFLAGKSAMIYDGLPAILKSSGYASTLPQSNKDWSAAAMLPFGDGKAYADNINVARTMITKGDDSEDRIKALLRTANYLAAPFGSTEYLLINYGAEGEDYTLDGKGNPQATDQGANNTSVPWKYFAAPTQPVYDPGNKDAVKQMHEAFSTMIPDAIEDPTNGIYSPTSSSKAAEIAQPITDATQNYLAGRGDLDQFTDAVKKWKSNGGDDIRGELLEGLGKKSSADS